LRGGSCRSMLPATGNTRRTRRSLRTPRARCDTAQLSDFRTQEFCSISNDQILERSDVIGGRMSCENDRATRRLLLDNARLRFHHISEKWKECNPNYHAKAYIMMKDLKEIISEFMRKHPWISSFIILILSLLLVWQLWIASNKAELHRLEAEIKEKGEPLTHDPKLGSWPHLSQIRGSKTKL